MTHQTRALRATHTNKGEVVMSAKSVESELGVTTAGATPCWVIACGHPQAEHTDAGECVLCSCPDFLSPPQRDLKRSIRLALYYGRDGHGSVPFAEKDRWLDGYDAAVALVRDVLDEHS